MLNKKGQEVYSIQASQSVYEAVAEMDAKNVGALIVKQGDKVAGIISERDYVRKVILKGRSSKETQVETIMTRDLVFVNPEHTIPQSYHITHPRANPVSHPRTAMRPVPRFHRRDDLSKLVSTS